MFDDTEPSGGGWKLERPRSSSTGPPLFIFYGLTKTKKKRGTHKKTFLHDFFFFFCLPTLVPFYNQGKLKQNSVLQFNICP